MTVPAASRSGQSMFTVTYTTHLVRCFNRTQDHDDLQAAVAEARREGIAFTKTEIVCRTTSKVMSLGDAERMLLEGTQATAAIELPEAA